MAFKHTEYDDDGEADTGQMRWLRKAILDILQYAELNNLPDVPALRALWIDYAISENLCPDCGAEADDCVCS